MPREILHQTSADSRRVPWRNGRGTTEELAIWPAGATLERGDFDWRISKARVTTKAMRVMMKNASSTNVRPCSVLMTVRYTSSTQRSVVS